MNAQAGHEPAGVVRGIAYRPHRREAMTEVAEATLVERRGLASEDRAPGKREVTLLSAQAWRDACAELGVGLPWHTRRANILIEGLDLPATIGLSLQIGDARVLIHDESRPCALMDELHPGLRQTLNQHGRGGVAGQVLQGGTVRVGDHVNVCGT
ncbi:MAG: MOSC domain-containing protein [Phycisphaerae bacterium]